MSRGLGGSLRTVGVDDGYFPVSYKESRSHTILAAVLCEGIVPVDVRLAKVKVDFDDINSSIISLVSGFSTEKLDLLILDGVTYAGFNVVDPDIVHAELGVPTMVFFEHDLNLQRIKEALFKHFPDGAARFEIISRVYSASRRVPTPWREVRMYVVGISERDALDMLIKLQNTSPVPEPLRIADLVASGLTRGTGLLKILNESRT